MVVEENYTFICNFVRIIYARFFFLHLLVFDGLQSTNHVHLSQSNVAIKTQTTAAVDYRRSGKIFLIKIALNLHKLFNVIDGEAIVSGSLN